MADFAALKERITIEQAAQMLGLQLRQSSHQLRGPCPACDAGGERALAITPSKGLFYCFNAGIGGDLITLVSHVREMPLKDAAEELAQHFGVGTTQPQKKAPSAPSPSRETEGELKPLEYLEVEHAAVEAVGFDPEAARALGIGYATKGIMRGTVAVPLRHPDGTLAGYIGITEAKLPKSFRFPNVVPFKKQAL